MRISTQAFYERNAAGMGSLQQQLFRIQQKLGAGTKFLTPSDDPVAAARSIGVSQSLSETAQYASSRGRAAQSLSMEEGALRSATTILQDVKTLVIQAGNGTLTEADRATLATALEGKYAELVGVANSDDGNGQYLFAGFRSDAPAFALQGDGSALYQGDSGQRLLQVDVSRQMSSTDDGATVFQSVQGSASCVPAAAATNSGTGVFSEARLMDSQSYTIAFAGGQFTVDDGTTQVVGAFQSGQPITAGGLSIRIDGQPADGDVFTVRSAQTAGTDIFQTLRSLTGALRAPVADAAGRAQLRNALSTANVKVTNAHDQLLTISASVGSRLAELDSLDATGDWRNLVDQTYLSQLQDLDYASAITEFSQRQTNLQATQQTFARLQDIALFNYL